MTRTTTQEPLNLPIPRTLTITEQRATAAHLTPSASLTPIGPPPATQRIAGIDYSLTATGIAIITRRVNNTCIINTITIKTSGKLTDPTNTKYERLAGLARDIKHATGPLLLMLIEGCNFHGQGQLDRLYAGWWMTVGQYVKTDTPIAVISPTSIKLAITGTSKADKSVMGGHIKKLWPELDYGNENEADAAGLAHLGAVRLGWNVPTLERHKQVKAQWPIFGSGSSLEDEPAPVCAVKERTE